MCIVICCPACDVTDFEIDLSFFIKAFPYMTKNSGQNINTLRTKRAFSMEEKAFFIDVKGLQAVRNCLRLESGPLML